MITEGVISELLDDLRDLTAVIVVEGKRDKNVLKKLGVKKVEDISGKSVEEVVEDVCKIGDEVLILTDFDREGRNLEKILKKEFEARKVKVLSSLRNRIKRKLKDVYKIEEIGKVLKLWGDVYGKNCSINDKVLNRVRILRRRGGRKT